WGKNTTQIVRLDEPGKATVWLNDTQGIDGTFLGNDGRLLAAQLFGHRVLSYGIGPDGPSDTRVLFHDPKLNQPNDVTQSPRGEIYFSDPDLAKKKNSAVFLITNDGQVKPAAFDVQAPNGLAVSIDGATLYVGD